MSFALKITFEYSKPPCLERISLKLSQTKIDEKATLMWFNKNVTIINVMLNILDITSLRSIFFSINLDLE